MKILLVVGFLIVFISAFFVLFLFDNLTKKYVECIPESDVTECDLHTIKLPFFFSLVMIGVFISVSAIAVYLLVKTLLSPDFNIGTARRR